MNEDYISFIKDLVLHHCLRCGILSESSTCEICRKEITGQPVMVKVEVKITASDVNVETVGLEGDFTQFRPGRIYWRPSERRSGSLMGFKGDLGFRGGDVD